MLSRTRGWSSTRSTFAVCVCKDMDVRPIQPKKGRPSSWYKLALRFKEINRTLFLPRLRYMRELGHPLADTLEYSGYSECRDIAHSAYVSQRCGSRMRLMSITGRSSSKRPLRSDWHGWGEGLGR